MSAWLAASVLLAAFLVVERRVAHPMFDLSLFRVPTFSGGSVAAFAMNGSLYAMLLYFVLYLQDVLGYSALGAGFAPAQRGALFPSVFAGRFAARAVPLADRARPAARRDRPAPHGRADRASGWTHLIPGFIVAGARRRPGQPAARVDRGRRRPARKAGMASGVNTTFRQIGIATGIAALGSIFTR